MTALQEKQKEPVKERKEPVTKKETIYLISILAVAVAIACMLLFHPRTGATSSDAAAQGAADAEPTVITREVEKLVEIEKAVTAEMLQDGLSDMGFLQTAEYYFTDLVSYSSIKKFLKTDIEIPFTESSYHVCYDGVVNAGIDLAKARVEKDDGEKRITVHIPAATIQTVDIDLDSFRLIDEKAGIGNRLSIQDFNRSLQELESTARQKAVERGLLDKAAENAKVLVSRFVGTLVDTSVYSLTFVTD